MNAEHEARREALQTKIRDLLHVDVELAVTGRRVSICGTSRQDVERAAAFLTSTGQLTQTDLRE